MKKSMWANRVIAITLATAMGLSVAPASEADAANSANLNKKKITIKAKSKYTLKVKGKSIKSISWKTSAKKVATVKKKNKLSAVVTAKKKGTAYVTAKVKFVKGKSKSLKCKVTVKEKNVVKDTPTPDANNVTVTPTQNVVVNPTAIPTQPGPTSEPTETPVPELDMNNLTVADYPGIYADIPDPDIIRFGGNYYMVSTTMNLVPGVPVMKSTDLVNWEIVNYACNRFPDKDLFNLEDGRQTYGNGSWAASL